jgi:hypothetical protein
MNSKMSLMQQSMDGVPGPATSHLQGYFIQTGNTVTAIVITLTVSRI